MGFICDHYSALVQALKLCLKIFLHLNSIESKSKTIFKDIEFLVPYLVQKTLTTKIELELGAVEFR